jgi:hypothetical protein
VMPSGRSLSHWGRGLEGDCETLAPSLYLFLLPGPEVRPKASGRTDHVLEPLKL